MRIIKLIDILVKVANNEEVPIFKYEEHRYKYNKENKYFEDLDNDEYCKPDVFLVELNDEVEVLEDTPKKDKKYIEHIKMQENELHNHLNIIDKINEIIDKINGE